MDLDSFFARDDQHRHAQRPQRSAVDFRVRVLAARHHPEKARVLHDARPRFCRQAVEAPRLCKAIHEKPHGRFVIAGREGFARRVLDAAHEIVVQRAAFRKMPRPREQRWLGEHQAANQVWIFDRHGQRSRRTHRCADEIHVLELQRLDERRQVRGFDEHGMVGRRLRILVGEVVTAAIGDDLVVARELGDLRLPRAIVTLSAVQQDQRLAGAGADVVQLDAIDDDFRGLGRRGMSHGR